MLMQAAHVVSVGSTVQVGMELKSGSLALRIAARVVRSLGDDCMGLQIENAGREEAKRLQGIPIALNSGRDPLKRKL
jgi:hypothetical protein